MDIYRQLYLTNVPRLTAGKNNFKFFISFKKVVQPIHRANGEILYYFLGRLDAMAIIIMLMIAVILEKAGAKMANKSLFH